MSDPWISDASAPSIVMAPASSWSGAAVAFSISFVAGLIGLGFDQPLLLIGIPAATIAGWRLGPRIRPTGDLISMTVAMSFATVAIADTLVVIPLGIGSSMSASAAGSIDPFRGIAASLFLWFFGFILVGVPMMIVTVPCGLLWAALVRKLARSGTTVAREP
jgi:hypothetical protein